MIIQPINDSGHYRSKDGDKESDPKIDPKFATHTDDRKKRKFYVMETTNVDSLHKSLINRLVPEIIPATILAIDQVIAEDAALVDQTLEGVGAILPQDIIPGTTRGAVIGFNNSPVINWEDASGTHPVDVICFERTPESTPTI